MSAATLAADGDARRRRYLRPMAARLRGLPGVRPVPALVDAGFAALLAVYGLGHIWLGWVPDEGYAGGPRGLDTVVVLLCTVPLAWRRRAPLAAFTVIIATFSLAQPLTSASASFFAGLLPALIGAYSVARYEDGRRVIAAIAIGLGGMLLLVATTPNFQKPEELLFETFLWSSAWLLGWTIRRGEKRARELGKRAERLEREREEQARAAVLDERARIARELHDVVAHGVSVMVVQAGAARSMLPPQDDATRAQLRSIEGIGRQALTEMRHLLEMLRDHDELALEPLPGIGQLEALVAAAREANLPVEVRIEGQPQPLPPGVDLTAYRIVQEGLTNAIKHAGAATAVVTVRYLADALELEILDDGAGASSGNGSGAATGHGLIGMRERTALYGGELQVGPRADAAGFAVRVRLPVAAEEW
jgi:signal transduction histidine kinase